VFPLKSVLSMDSERIAGREVYQAVKVPVSDGFFGRETNEVDVRYWNEG